MRSIGCIALRMNAVLYAAPPGSCENEISFLVSVLGLASAYPESMQ